MTNDGTSTWVAVDGNFYRIVFGEEPGTEEEEQMSPWHRAQRMTGAFVRRCISVTHWRRREQRTPSTTCPPGPARKSSASALPATSIAALVDVFRMLQAWDDETHR